MALTLDNTLGELLDDPKVEAYFNENLQEIMTHPNLAMAKTMPFNTIAAMAGGRISMESIDNLEAFLKTL